MNWLSVFSEIDRLQRRVEELAEETSVLRRRLSEVLAERDDWRSRSGS